MATTCLKNGRKRSSKPAVESFDYSFSSLAPPAFSSTGDDQRYNNSDDESSHGSCEYDGDNDDDVNDTEGKESEDDEEYDNKLEKRIEGFIAKVHQKRREEFLGDRLLCITAAMESGGRGCFELSIEVSMADYSVYKDSVIRTGS
ncbi:hypothetical protein DKX38_002895 [Salix brachista]|uniref:Uncharacterized protein n=1 Tax=Salix brachista TaxID=2182728 RepID=A0A5N5NP52_9ROSI|nr:hypothetical protein DKX38_002895 [Salix brachista]